MNNQQRRDTPQGNQQIEFRPQRQTSIVPLLEQEAARQRNNFRLYGEQLSRNAQTAVDNARNQGAAQARNDQYQLRQLAELQRSLGQYNTFLSKKFEEEDRLRKEEEEINAFWHSLMVFLQWQNVLVFKPVDKHSQQWRVVLSS